MRVNMWIIKCMGEEYKENSLIYCFWFKLHYYLYYFSDGARYEGNYEKGQKNGSGAYFYTDGDIYQGGFINDAF